MASLFHLTLWTENVLQSGSGVGGTYAKVDVTILCVPCHFTFYSVSALVLLIILMNVV